MWFVIHLGHSSSTTTAITSGHAEPSEKDAGMAQERLALINRLTPILG
jgi:hypothetical protein